MTVYALHPDAFIDIDEIREYIAEDDPVNAALHTQIPISAANGL